MNLEKFLKQERNFYDEILWRNKSYSEQQKIRWRQETVFERKQRLSNELFDRYDGVVQNGIFRGMSLKASEPRGLPDKSSMLLGLYEYQILKYIESKGKYAFDLFVDIGASEGYYPIGMLASGYARSAIAFEADSECVRVMKNAAEMNGVSSKLSIFGLADENLGAHIPSNSATNTLILCDIAGGEFDLFSSSVFGDLRHCTLIIEIHDWTRDNFLDEYFSLITKASGVFELSILPSVSRPIEEIYDLHSFTDDNRLLVASEHRPNQMRFLKLEPKRVG